MSLHLVPIVFRDARAFVSLHHRHHLPPVGCKFCIGVATEANELVGVAIVGRPVARFLDDGLTLEVSRTATDGEPNANSMLYGAAWRATKALGFIKLITYTQDGESGSSLRAAGWRVVAERRPRPGWNMPSRPRHTTGPEHIARALWEAPQGDLSPVRRERLPVASLSGGRGRTTASSLGSLTQPLFEETPVGPTIRIPIGATSAWLVVVETRAQLQCECVGQCGVAHTAGRCKVRHQGWHNKRTAVLIAAPKPDGLLLPLSQKAALPNDALMAWCQQCLTKAEKLAAPPK